MSVSASARSPEPPDTEPPASCDLAVVGGGIVGLAVARELIRRHPRASVCVLEREPELAAHQTGHSSGVVHAGIYYRPGSLKARLCVEGARELYEYCAERAIPHERRGKLILATSPAEVRRLQELQRRGEANGVMGLRWIDGPGIERIEPHARGLAALHSPAPASSTSARWPAPTRTTCSGGRDGGVRLRRAGRRGRPALAAPVACARQPASPLRGLLRRRLGGPAGGGGGRRPRSADRAVPRRLPAPAARAPPPRALADLPHARPGAAVSRRAPDQAHRRPGVDRPDRPDRRCSRCLPPAHRAPRGPARDARVARHLEDAQARSGRPPPASCAARRHRRARLRCGAPVAAARARRRRTGVCRRARPGART